MEKGNLSKRYSRILLEGLQAATSFLLKKALPKESFHLAEIEPETGKREVALIIQYIGNREGEMILITSRATARAFTDSLFIHEQKSLSLHEEMKLIKDSLGELVSILASKIAASFPEEYGIVRVTTPSCIFGTDLTITPCQGKPFSAAVKTPFGIMEFSLTIPDGEED
jgi:CheY-specific phosphatase CheX